MSSGERVRVADAFDLQTGKTPSRKNPEYWRDGTHDWVSIADLGSFDKYVGKTKECINDLGIKESRIKPAPANTILMSFKLSIGKTAITVDPVYTNEAIMAFVDKGTHPVDVNFMYHQCKSKDWTHGTNTAVMGKTLNKKTLGNALIWLPCLDDQRRIAAELDFIDGQIKTAERQIAQLDQLVKSRFVEMFGNAAHPTKRLVEVAEIQGGLTKNRKRETLNLNLPYLRVANVLMNELDLTEMKTIGLTEQEFEATKLVPGDLLFVEGNGSGSQIGRSAIWAGTIDPCVHQNHLIRARFGKAILPVYAQAYFSSPEGRSQVISKAVSTSGLLTLSTGKIKALEIPVPPLPLQQDFAAFVAQVDKTRAIAQQQIDKLQTLYDSLAQDYFA